ncbi:MAG: beta-hydroxyacyl-ACP dehydratase [Sedimentisphaerales bacterium]|nr:beta-hydroxyacyl-ACP dehydratase [Sedimentisphaerales bacterium]
MPPPLLVNLDTIDLNHIIFDTAAIERVNPHRYEMRQLDGIIWHDQATATVLGYKDITPDEFWVRGHIPGRPLMPGVIMVEAAAQLASFYIKFLNKDDRFIGFGGIEDVKFRGTVQPGDRLLLMGKLLENRPRRFICAAQGVVNGQMVFQAKIIGMPV